MSNAQAIADSQEMGARLRAHLDTIAGQDRDLRLAVAAAAFLQEVVDQTFPTPPVALYFAVGSLVGGMLATCFRCRLESEISSCEGSA